MNIAAGKFAASSTSGTALVAESPAGTQIMKADATGIHAGPGMTCTPLAYGAFNQDGSKAAGSSNLSCTWDTGFSRYECVLTGDDYHYLTRITNVTPIGSATTVIPTTSSVSGHLLVYLFNTSGAKVQAGFAVAVYKP